MEPIPDIYVVGTDTGVGKTVVSLLLMQLLYAKGYRPFYIKPLQTGCADPYDRESDAAFVYRYTAALKGKDPARSVICCYPEPKAPFFAARDVGERVDLEKIRSAVIEKRSTHSPLVVEAAGGLLVPVTENTSVIDIIPSINCRPLLVARAGLGTINHTLLSIEALVKREIPPSGVVLVQSSCSSDEIGLVNENMEAIAAFSGIRPTGVIPRLHDFSAPPPEVYQLLESIVHHNPSEDSTIKSKDVSA